MQQFSTIEVVFLSFAAASMTRLASVSQLLEGTNQPSLSTIWFNTNGTNQRKECKMAQINTCLCEFYFIFCVDHVLEV